jgi:hypothetical protein
MAILASIKIKDPDLKGLLLSPRATSPNRKMFSCCASCHSSIVRGSREENASPPKYVIANGFVIGSIPDELKYVDKDGVPQSCKFREEEDLDDIICAAISPVRPFGYVQGWSGGKQKSLAGHFSLFSVDQSHVGGVLNKYKNVGNSEMQPSKNMFLVIVWTNDAWSKNYCEAAGRTECTQIFTSVELVCLYFWSQGI